MTHAATQAATGPVEGGSAAGLSRRRAETRNRLIAAAVTVFASVGVDQARVEDISEEAGYTRGAFYSNFADKDELIVALLQRQLELATSAIETSLGQVLAAPLPDDFTQLVHDALDVFDVNMPDPDWMLAELGLRMYARRNPAIEPHLRAYEERRLASMVEVLDNAMTQAGVRATIPMEHLISIAMAIQTDCTVRTGVAPEESGTTPAARDLMVSMLAGCIEPIR